MDLLEQSEVTPEAADAAPSADAPNPESTEMATANDAAALLGLPPGVSAPEGVESLVAPAAAAAQQIQWYHLDPNETYQELRTGTGPGLYRGLAFGTLMSL